MSKPLLIGLCGRAGCGKDTMADYFVRDFGIQRYALAGPIKAALSSMLDITPGQLEDREYKERVIEWIGKSPRQMLQTLGTEWGRQMIHPNLWVNLMSHRWEMTKAMGLPGLVVTDVRFPNEAEKLHHLGGFLVRILRPDVRAVAEHSSEQGVEDRWIDDTVVNDKGILHLRVEAARIVRLADARQ